MYGKQRVLTQKMSKEFLLVAYGHEAEDNKLSLLKTYTLLERTLKGLLDDDETLGLPGTKPQHIRDQLGVVNELWAKFKPTVEYGADHNTTSIPKEKIGVLASTNLPLLRSHPSITSRSCLPCRPSSALRLRLHSPGYAPFAAP